MISSWVGSVPPPDTTPRDEDVSLTSISAIISSWVGDVFPSTTPNVIKMQAAVKSAPSKLRDTEAYGTVKIIA